MGRKTGPAAKLLLGRDIRHWYAGALEVKLGHGRVCVCVPTTTFRTGPSFSIRFNVTGNKPIKTEACLGKKWKIRALQYQRRLAVLESPKNHILAPQVRRQSRDPYEPYNAKDAWQY